MAATADVRTFWSALISVLLKCIAALGFATPAKFAAVGPQAQAAADVPARIVDGTGVAPVAGRRAGSPYRIPAPRAYAPLRRERDRKLPPTMKQRIRAEAHGASPSARSIPADDLTDGIVIPAPARRDRMALCA
ncbi:MULTISPECIES: DUF6344 domain-containing protein [unclassified Streptomyces]|uniref:DUF6344 domain-containing protein n=1 Tax=unclassified Streptomyces TaxID=2593676 RepID=UPI002E28F6CD|nr:DUF6344 domain-containing protein [Streptomyces sp. NBC_00223]